MGCLSLSGSAEQYSDIYVANVPDATRRFQVSTGKGQLPRWRGDGKEIFYVSTDLKLMGVPVNAKGDHVEFGQPKPLFDLPSTGGVRLAYDVTADGQRFLFQTSDEDPGTEPIRLVQNWPAVKLKQ